MEGASASSRTCSSNAEIVDPPADGVVGPGSIVTVVYEGDDESAAERYLVGHIEEERQDDLDVVSPESPLGLALIGARDGEWVTYEAPNGRAAREGAQGRDGLAVIVPGHAWLLRSAGRDRSRMTDRCCRSPVDRPAGRAGGPPRAPRTAGRADDRPAPRARRHGRHQLLPLLPALGEQFRVLAFDHRGHGDGHPHAPPVPARATVPTMSWRWPTSSASTGSSPSATRWAGPIAQLVWRRHRRRVGGLVLCATATPLQRHAGRAGQLPRPRRAGRDGPPDAARRAPHDRRSLPARSPCRLGDRGHASRRPARTGGRCSKRAPRSAGSAPIRGSPRSTSRLSVVMTLARLDGAGRPPTPARRVAPRRRRVPRRRRTTTPSASVPQFPPRSSRRSTRSWPAPS